ncbi:uncharacterized protein KQ657_001772 [Scheffersomyces spartinae]|uniref:DNA polymerase delta subunit 3 n=1 Tax=Scheffersomyces spartinae TaxID=45513 RepID=A0A9P8AH63_9ASCO|nr:uncharacterized protein KQ657_001772 [Scheffersomyces spartinae]KAG7192373.1 hypothetical protein KQ657_001772 [Scheffersomyces spartinae]
MEYLSSEILTKDGTVTYNTFARTQGLLVTKAKQILYDFYVANKAKLYASFIVIGQPKEKSIKTTCIIKCDSNNVDAVVKDLQRVEAVHVYYVSRYCVENLQLAIVESSNPLDRLSIDNLGIIRNSVKFNPVSRTKTNEPIKSKAVPSSKTTTNDVQKHNAKEPKREKLSSSLSSLYVSRKASANTSSVNSKKQPALKYQSRKVQKVEPKERVIMAEDNNEEDIEMTEVEPKAYKTEVASMKGLFDDLSDFDDTEETIEVAEPIIVEEQTKLEFPSENQEDEKPKPSTETLSEPRNEYPVEYETVTIVNDDGCFETIKKPIESNSNNKPTPVPLSSRVRARSPFTSTANSKRKKGQATLQSFFKPNK